MILPGGTATHVAGVQQHIAQIKMEATTTMASSVQELFERSSRRGVLVVFSDFLADDLEDVFSALRLFRQRQWEVLTLHIVHPDEERLPEGAAYRFEGLENDGSLSCSPAEIRAAYQERFEAHAASVRTFALAAGCDYRRLSTGIDYQQALCGFLVERSG